MRQRKTKFPPMEIALIKWFRLYDESISMSGDIITSSREFLFQSLFTKKILQQLFTCMAAIILRNRKHNPQPDVLGIMGLLKRMQMLFLYLLFKQCLIRLLWQTSTTWMKSVYGTRSFIVLPSAWDIEEWLRELNSKMQARKLHVAHKAKLYASSYKYWSTLFTSKYHI